MEKIVIGSLLVAVRFFPRPNIPSNLVLREFAFHFSKTVPLTGQRLKLGTAVKSFWVALHIVCCSEPIQLAISRDSIWVPLETSGRLESSRALIWIGPRFGWNFENISISTPNTPKLACTPMYPSFPPRKNIYFVIPLWDIGVQKGYIGVHVPFLRSARKVLKKVSMTQIESLSTLIHAVSIGRNVAGCSGGHFWCSWRKISRESIVQS